MRSSRSLPQGPVLDLLIGRDEKALQVLYKTVTLCPDCTYALGGSELRDTCPYLVGLVGPAGPAGPARLPRRRRAPRSAAAQMPVRHLLRKRNDG